MLWMTGMAQDKGFYMTEQKANDVLGDIYNEDFYKVNEDCTRRTPRTIFEIMTSLLEIKTLCDVGGGVGLWTSIFIEMNKDADLERPYR